MSEFFTFIHLGFRHIVDPGAVDHILFLLALAAIYRAADWREGLGVVSAFTVGHSITLALAATGTLPIPTRLVEFLIPVTIVATGIDNLVRSGVRPRGDAWRRPLLAGIFGLVHGAGFANYLHDFFMGSITVPLFGFNVGIELGQVVLLAGASALFALIDRLLARLPRSVTVWSTAPAHRLRAAAVSSVVVLVAMQMLVTRRPW
jgi:hypothetical protein